MLIGENDLIDGISSSCINILKIDVKYITKRKTKITDLIRNFHILKEDFLDKKGFKFMYKPPFDVDKDYFSMDEEKTSELLGKLSPIIFKSLSKEENDTMIDGNP